MKQALTVVLALALSSCAYLPREPFCAGADAYRGMSRMKIAKIPTNLRQDVEGRSGSTLEAWYQGGSDAVVIAVVKGRGDHEFRYRVSNNVYDFTGEKEVPCLQDASS